ncbi:MAG: hypothetical protein RMZ69_05115 [Nostoc sp. ChiQUE01a]|nr:hypothetical protein [Nostoc sp. ChiQUE01a]
MTRTFNSEYYAKLLAEYQLKIITSEEENEQASNRTCFNFSKKGREQEAEGRR